MIDLERCIKETDNPYVVMGMGVPFTRKTTLLQPFAKKHGLQYIAPITTRIQLEQSGFRGDITERTRWLTDEEVQYHLGNRDSVVIDARHLDNRYRQLDIERYRGFGARAVIGASFTANLNILESRREECGDYITREELEGMFKRFKKWAPHQSEGFDALVGIDTTWSVPHVS